MAFILKTDYQNAIRERILDDITEFDDNLLTQAGDFAVSFMDGYLRNRYDTSAIFAETGNSRNPVILMYAIDIAIYQLHHLINPRKVPDMRMERFEKAQDWLQRVSKQLINPDLPVHASPDTIDFIKFGGNTKRSNHV